MDCDNGGRSVDSWSIPVFLLQQRVKEVEVGPPEAIPFSSKQYLILIFIAFYYWASLATKNDGK